MVKLRSQQSLSKYVFRNKCILQNMYFAINVFRNKCILQNMYFAINVLCKISIVQNMYFAKMYFAKYVFYNVYTYKTPGL